MILLVLLLLLVSFVEVKSTMMFSKRIGGVKKDDCFTSAGYLKCKRTKECIRWWEKYHTFEEMLADCGSE